MLCSELPQLDPTHYRIRLFSGEMKTGSHQDNAQEALDEGSAAVCLLVSATTTNATGLSGNIRER